MKFVESDWLMQSHNELILNGLMRDCWSLVGMYGVIHFVNKWICMMVQILLVANLILIMDKIFYCETKTPSYTGGSKKL